MTDAKVEPEDFDSNIMSHDEICELINKLLEYEEKFKNFETYDEVVVEEPLVELDVVEEFIELPDSPTVFRIGVDESGGLVNLDLRKPAVRVKKARKIKLGFKLRGRKKSKDEKTKEKVEEKVESGKKSKLSKIKGGFGKLGKLKRIIPSKSKKKKESSEEKE